jgi:hypothetical protein
MSSSAVLPKLFRWAFTFVEVLAGLAALLILLAILVHPSLPPDAHFGPVHGEIGGQQAELSLQPPAGGHGAASFVVHLFNGNATVTVDAPAQLIALLIGYGLPVFLIHALFLAVLFDLLRRLFGNVGRGESFTPQSVRLVQIVGGTLIVFSVISTLVKNWVANVIVRFLMQHTAITVSQAPVRLPQISAHHIYLGHWLPFGDGVFWSGLLVLALAEVFRQGLALKREHDLTV